MDRTLQGLVRKAKEETIRSNPPVATATKLQELIAQTKKAFSIDDIIDAGRSLGMSDDDIIVFLEEQASWIRQTNK